MARKFFLPDQVLQKDNDWVLLFNSGGDTQQPKLHDFLADLLPLVNRAQDFRPPDGLVASTIDYLFIFDVDTKGVEHRVNKMRKEFCQITLKQFDGDNAAITLLGQHKKPGGSMAVIVDQSKLLTKTHYQQSSHVQDFVRFLDNWF
jgi:hypothetical protein